MHVLFSFHIITEYLNKLITLTPCLLMIYGKLRVYVISHKLTSLSYKGINRSIFNKVFNTSFIFYSLSKIILISAYYISCTILGIFM